MKSLHILYLEDDLEDSISIVNLLSKSYQLTIVKNLKEGKVILEDHQFDLAILDININGKPDGIEFAKHLTFHCEDMPFIFLTSIRSKAIFDEAKLTLPYSYLTKPFNELELEYNIELAIEKHFGQERTLRKNPNAGVIKPGFLFIKKGQSIFKLALNDIGHVDVDENYSTLYSTSESKYLINLSLSKLKDILPSEDFIQVHRKSLVNIHRIKEVNLSENTLYLDSNQMVTISERYKKRFSQSFNILK